jgi:hypothetical protein
MDADMVEMCKVVAKAKGWTMDEVVKRTAANTLRILQINQISSSEQTEVKNERK